MTTVNRFDLTGKVALVTGSTKGLGRAMAKGLAEAGADVVVSSRKQELCDAAAEEIAATTGRRTLGLACHVGDWDAIAPFVDSIVERFGTIDILVNNAGINPAGFTIADTTLDYWRKVMSVNLEGPLRMSQVVARVMRDHGGGSIINVSSMGGYSGGYGVGVYGVSKAGLLNLTRTCAREWAPWGVRVNAISPGPIRSEMTEGAESTTPGWYDRAGSATMQHRVADTEEVIGPVVYLASDAASFITGEDHCVAGGMLR